MFQKLKCKAQASQSVEAKAAKAKPAKVLSLGQLV
jgi:hypothetical protein